MPVYYLALQVIKDDSARLKGELERLRAEEKVTPQLEKQMEKLEIMSQINVPWVKWDFEHGKGISQQ